MSTPNNPVTNAQNIKITPEQAKALELKKQADQIKGMNLPKDVEKKMLKALGIVEPSERFERFDYKIDNPKNANHGKVIPMITINPDKGQGKSITLWQAQLLADNFDAFILFYESMKEMLEAEGYDVKALTER